MPRAGAWLRWMLSGASWMCCVVWRISTGPSYSEWAGAWSAGAYHAVSAGPLSNLCARFATLTALHTMLHITGDRLDAGRTHSHILCVSHSGIAAVTHTMYHSVHNCPAAYRLPTVAGAAGCSAPFHFPHAYNCVAVPADTVTVPADVLWYVLR